MATSIWPWGQIDVAGSSVTVHNLGGFAVPFDMLLEYADGTKETLHQSAAVWRANQQQAVITTPKAVKSIKLDGGIFMDANEKDNSFGR